MSEQLVTKSDLIEIRDALRWELTAIRSAQEAEKAEARLKRRLNEMTFDFALLLLGACTLFYAAMKLT